jgi:hypothetical protein
MTTQALVTKIFFDIEGSVENFTSLLKQITQHHDIKAIFILACDANGFTPQYLDAHLQALPMTVCGAIYPKIIYQKQYYTKGTLICALSQPIDVYNSPSLLEYQKEMLLLSACDWLGQARSIIALIDVMCNNSEPFIEELYNYLGPTVPIAGGCAGSATFQSKPCIFTHQGLVANIAQLIHFPGQLHLGVRHGWQPIAGPFLVTHAQGNKLFALNYEPAFQVYRQAIESFVEHAFDNKDFFSVTNEFPLGFDRADEELLTRVPLYAEGETLVCPGSVPQHAMAYVLRGYPEQIIQAANNAAQEAMEHIPAPHTELALNFNCIGRFLFLENNFGKELAGIESVLPPHTLLCGALTLGEIASSNKGGVQLFNNTAVIGLLNTAAN